MQKILSNFKFWIDNARWIALPQSILPALVAWVMAWRVSRTQNPLSQYDFCSSDIQYSFSLALLALIGVILLHLGLNLFDDYFDYKVKKTQYRNDMAAQGIRARVAKCAYLKEEGGTATLQQLLYASLAFCFAALLIGCVIWFYRGNFILYVSLLSAIIGLQYSGGPLRLSYHGLGELTVGFIFGPLLMIGVYYSACGFWNYSTLWIFASIGLLVS
ncbi:MAG: prenyltransferase, partial [Bacteroidales bacterium]